MSVLALVRSTPEASASAVLDMKQRMVDYWNAVSIINANSFAITNTQLTAIDDTEPVPAWWNTLSTNFGSCREHAKYWIDTVYPSLTRVPQSIITYNTFFNATAKSLADLIAGFSSRLPTAEEKTSVQAKLNLLLTQLGKSKAQVNAVRVDVKTFTDSFDADRIALTTGSASVMEALAADRTKVTAINALIAELKADIKALEIALSVAGVATTIVMTIAYAVGGVPGLIIGIVGVGASTAVSIILGGKIAAKNSAIETENNKLGLIARRAVSLNAIDAGIQDQMASIDAIQSCCEIVSKTWGQFETDLGGLIVRLQSAHDTEWTEIIRKGMDISASQEAWKNLARFAQDLQRVDMAFDPNAYVIKGAA
jgi:hypothetical protein